MCVVHADGAAHPFELEMKSFFPSILRYCCCCFFILFFRFRYNTYFHISCKILLHAKQKLKGDGNEHFTNNIVLFPSFTWFCYHYYMYILVFLHTWFGFFFFCVCVVLFIYSKITTRSSHTLYAWTYDEWVIDRIQIKILYSFCQFFFVSYFPFDLNLKLLQLDSHLVATTAITWVMQPNGRQIPMSMRNRGSEIRWVNEC